jgi:hypothetical protein
MTAANIIQIAAVIIALSGLIISNILIFRQIQALKQQARLTNDRMRMDYNLALRTKALSYSIFSNIHLRDARLNIEEKFRPYIHQRKRILPETIEEMEQKEPGIRSDMMTMLAHWENMALAIHSDIADESVAKDMAATILRTHTLIFGAFIDERREANPRAYAHLLKLKEKWDNDLGPPGANSMTGLNDPDGSR